MAETKPHVLVVDDSRVVRRTISKFLSPYFNVTEAEHGVEGWRVLRQNSNIELVITDIQMPEMDGYTFICKVRAEEDAGLRDIPIIVITSAEDEITRERAYACGANDFVLKPFNNKDLLECTKAQLSDYRESVERVEKVAEPVEEVVMPNADGASLTAAVTYIDTGMKMLASLNSNAIAPHSLALVLRFLPLLKFCNTKFELGMDSEIATFQQRVAAARDALKKA
ncbi:MAG: response regulator [Acidiferrobacterales bacterium]|jgi:CheY-like chemotaxis protein|nr:response regulator [Acidiferrobacterales bacterium]